VTSGYIPLGGVLLSRAVCDVLEADPAYVLRHGHTYSGHPTAAAAGLAALDVTVAEGLLDRALKIGQHLGAALQGLVGDKVVEVRSKGAVFGVGLAPGLDPVQVRDHMLGSGVIARPIGTSTIAMCPPLVVTDDQLDRCVTALAGAL
jgi:adenosylmethionine-8-amino-7-oxononanoate aminotransferase